MLSDVKPGRKSAGSPATLVCCPAPALGPATPGLIRAEIFSQDGFRLTGDFRARLEADFDSQRSGGSERADRTRARFRLRLQAGYQANDRFSFGLRLRSGSDFSHQSPHVTVLDFDDNDTGDVHFNFDKWYARFEDDKGWLWAGRNSLPFWKQNELFWDDDVTPAGLAFGYKSGDFQLNGGYFSLPVGMQQFSGNLTLAQVVYSGESFTVAGGIWDIDANPDDADSAALLRGNGSRDYQVWLASIQAKTGKLTFGVDYAHNGESYSGEANEDEIDVYVGSIKYGGVKGKGDWQAAWYYAHVEALAVSSSYAQDDWVRWGSAVETRATDMEGHELRLVYGTGKGQDLTFRLYVAEAITNDEDGNRFRIDYNYKF